MINKSKNDDNNEIDLKRKLIDDPMNQMNKQKKKSVDDRKKKKKTIIENNGEIKRKKTIEELRAERLKRENEEKIKTQRLLNGPTTSSNASSSLQLDDRKRRYNSQFNPDLARY
jgi:hypothetical protein